MTNDQENKVWSLVPGHWSLTINIRIPSAYRERGSGVELQLTPMIDCVFLLIIYFLWSSSFAVAELSLPSRLSAAPATGAASKIQPRSAEADFPDVVVRIMRTDR